MMTKIFGVVLIVSGGYFIGKLRTNHSKNRYENLKSIQTLFGEFNVELREYRRSWGEFEETHSAVSKSLKECELMGEEWLDIEETIRKLQVGSFRESLEVSNALLERLNRRVKEMEEEIETTGRAFPLVTGAIALLVSVLLF